MSIDFDLERDQMVIRQIEQRGLRDPRLLAALRAVPRHRFVPPELQDEAYDDCPLPIGCGQTISQPYIVALMTHLLHLSGSETVLEVGTGSGYQAAVLAQLCAQVHSVELLPELAERAARTLAGLGIANAAVHAADGSLGWREAAPYGGILVTAASPAVPPPLLDQLAVGGRLVIPVGSRGGQVLEVRQRRAEGFEAESVLAVAFVPLRGAYGWSEEGWLDRWGR